VLIAWVVFPAVVVLLSAGCGLLLERVCRTPLPGALVVPAGFASIVVVGQLLTLADATAELTTPVVVALAVLGGGAALGRRLRAAEPWAVACAVAVFALYGAPVLLSGEATFAGYIKLDDTATWMAFTDRTMEYGRSLDGLAPSSYEATLDLNLAKGYPTAIFVPWGVGAAVTGQDLAWVFQPYEALLAALLALCLVAIAAPAVSSPRLRAVAALVAAQAALLVGYSLWGGAKEVAGAMLVALVAALAPLPLRRGSSGIGAAVPLALAAAALVGTLSVGAVVWLAPLLVPVAVAAARSLGRRVAIGRVAVWIGLATVAVVPALAIGGLLSPTTSSFTQDRALGNLFEPLSPLQALGIWPSGDFRLDPDAALLTNSLIALVAVFAVAGAWVAYRERAWTPLLYAAGAVGGSAAVVALGSPWAEAKALAIASPALLLCALIAAAWLTARGRGLRALGVAVLAAIAAGVGWSNVLAYREVNLAPRDQLAELELIGDLVAGQGPALMTEYQPYGVRHFLRAADPEGASELRRRQVLLRGGDETKKGAWADTDELGRDGLLVYRTLVLRRSPAQSRPPSPYELVWEGNYYEVWQRDGLGDPGVLARLPLGRRIEPAARAHCRDVMRLARLAGPEGRLAAATPARALVVRLSDTRVHPAGWEDPRYGPSTLLPRGAGTIQAHVRVGTPGLYEVWLGGSVRGEVELLVDGAPVGATRHRLNNAGQYVGLGETTLTAGRHELELRYSGPDLHPGSGGLPLPLGPLVLSRSQAADGRVTYVDPAGAASLCGRRWDWVEALET
jgi:hypothetical protein